MRRLVAFGDSWTAGHGVEEDSKYKEVAFPGVFVDSLRKLNGWPRWTAEKLGVPFVNLADCGLHNVDILNRIRVNARFLTNEDIVVVVWSYPYRHRDVDGLEVSLFEILSAAQISLQGLNYFFFNSFYPTFEQEPELKKLISFVKPDETLVDLLRGHEVVSSGSLWEYNSPSTVLTEEGFALGDYHPNLAGYKVIADFIYEFIKDRR